MPDRQMNLRGKQVAKLRMDLVNALVGEANGAFRNPGTQDLVFAAADDCSEDAPTLVLIDLENGGEEIARSDAHALERFIAVECLLPYLRSVSAVAKRAFGRGEQSGHDRATAAMRRAIGFQS